MRNIFCPKSVFFSFLLSIILTSSGFGQYTASEKLIFELKRYSIVRESWSPELIPLLMGNAEMGGLADPLGRGFYNLSLTDSWVDSSKRVAAPGIMLKMLGMDTTPVEYRQTLNLQHGILKTKVLYDSIGYESEIFISKEKKHLLSMKITNVGKKEIITCLQLDFAGYSAVLIDPNTIHAISTDTWFTHYSWAMSSSIPFRTYFTEMPKTGTKVSNINTAIRLPMGSKDITLLIQPGATAVFNFAITTQWDGDNYINEAVETAKSGNFETSLRLNNASWDKEWQNTATIILPQGKYAEVYYRSLFWLYCTAGSDHFLPGEVQFADLSVPMAADYRYLISYELASNWSGHPFTYGAAGWSAMAFTMIGNQNNAGKMLNWMYQPKEYHNNVTRVFPVGVKNIKTLDQTSKPGTYISHGEHRYLAKDNPNTFYLGHELMLTGRNINVFPWDWQAHIQAFGASLFHNYAQLYGTIDTIGKMAYPVLKGTAEFWSEMLQLNSKTGKYELPPLNSLSEVFFKANLLDVLLAAKWNLKIAVEYSKGKKEEQALNLKWKRLANNIEIPQTKEYYLEFKDDTGHREGGGYFGVRGFVYLAFPTVELIQELDKDKINRSLDMAWKRNNYGEGMITFVANWFALADSYMHNGNKALEKSSYCLHALDVSGTVMMEAPGKRPYYLDSYASFTVVPVSMLVQSVGACIETFPAVPDEWKDVAFYNIPAAGGIRVSGEMKGGKVLWVTYNKDGVELLKTYRKSKVIVSLKGNETVLKIA